MFVMCPGAVCPKVSRTSYKTRLGINFGVSFGRSWHTCEAKHVPGLAPIVLIRGSICTNVCRLPSKTSAKTRCCNDVSVYRLANIVVPVDHSASRGVATVVMCRGPNCQNRLSLSTKTRCGTGCASDVRGSGFAERVERVEQNTFEQQASLKQPAPQQLYV